MGWNDHLPDPDAWEDHAEALAERADLDRKRAKEEPARAGPITVYVPADDNSKRLGYIKRGSGIVGTPGQDPLHAVAGLGASVVIDYEGNVYDWPSMSVYADRVLHAADRHRTRYPTIARAVVPAETLIRVGEWDASNGRVYIDWPHDGIDPLALLKEWAGPDVMDQLRATTGPGARLP